MGLEFGTLAAAAVVVAVLGLAVLAPVSRRSRSGRGRRARPPEPPEEAALYAVERPWAAVVVNPTKITDLAVEQRWLERHSDDFGWGPSAWLETTRLDPGGGQARSALATGASTVVAYGGDGTVRSVAAQLAGSGVPLGLLPAGTGNLLARNLGIPLTDRDAAADVAFGGRERAIDVGRVEIDVSGEDSPPRRETFLVMAGLGFDAEVMASVHPQLKARVGWWAYVVAGLRIMRGRQTKVVLRLDEGPPLHRRVRSVVIGNCGELTGGVRLMPDALIDDGWLDVVIVSPAGLVGWAAVTGAVLTRSRWGHPLVEHFRCRSIRAHAEKPVEVQLDGDPVGQARVLRASVEHAALVVRSP